LLNADYACIVNACHFQQQGRAGLVTTKVLCMLCPQSVHYNGSLYSHVIFARSGIDLDSPVLDDVPADSIFSTSASA
jgi:hypothetical protein